MQGDDRYTGVSGTQIWLAVLLLAIAALIEGSSDWIDHGLPPSLTLPEILRDTLGMFALCLVIGVPITMVCWNKLLAPVFHVKRIGYVHGLILVAAASWIAGL